jgi:uncharacterized protein (DUF885 family)
MKSFITICFLLLVHLFANAQAKPSTADKIFNDYKEKFVLALWKQYPSWASSQGYHAYDSVLVLPNDNERKSSLTFCKRQLEALKKFDAKLLSDNNKIDLKMMASELEARIWYITEFKSHEWNPANYNICGDFAEMLANEYAPLEDRLRNFYVKMKNVKAYYETAKLNLKNPSKEHTLLAIEQNKGGISTFNEDLKAAIAKSKISKAYATLMTQRAKEATTAINEYADYLTNLKNEKPRSFRIGKDLYSKKFEYDIQSSYTATQIYDLAVAHKKELHVKMYNITKILWPKYMQGKEMPADKLVAIKYMIDAISVNHTTAENFQTEIENQIPALTNFIKEKNLLYLDPSKPLVVRKEPAYMAGVAGASISAPGPYDKTGNTYYNVGSFNGWDKERIESYLREYNYYILQILNIHEALPGHYAQLVYANKSPSIIKSIFGNGAMVEGWAVYAELMMLENGYGKALPSKEKSVTVAAAPTSENPIMNEEGMQTADNTNKKIEESSPEMWLMYSKWNLRSTCNTILDYDVHVNNISKEDAINFLTNEAFQQQAEATGKWRRVSVSQVQLTSYFTGFTEIYNLREELKKQMGNAYDQKIFNEKFLSFGSAPVKYIKELMLK